MENTSSSHKRARVDIEDDEVLETKRFRADILDILDDDEETDSAGEDLAGVMQSLEDEIALPNSSVPETYPDLGYLLEASDDELGLPPTIPSPAAGVASQSEGFGGDVEGYGQIWGLGDEIQPGFYDELDFQVRPETGGEGDGLFLFEEGLFEYGDVFGGSSDFADTTYRQESLPAV